MEAYKTIFLMILLSALLVGCGYKAPLAKPIALEKAAWREPGWGEEAEGLQSRLHPDKRTWQWGENPSFKLDIRNRGSRIFAIFPSHQLQLCRIQFDGKWHQWPEPIMIDSMVWPLAPGAQFADIGITLQEQFKINLTPGKHIIRIAFSLEGIEVISNPVGIEILPQGQKLKRQ
jgi:predicted small lipoprotein YifL